MSIARYEIYDNIGSMYELCSYYDNGVIMNELCSYISCMTFIMIPTRRSSLIKSPCVGFSSIGPDGYGCGAAWPHSVSPGGFSLLSSNLIQLQVGANIYLQRFFLTFKLFILNYHLFAGGRRDACGRGGGERQEGELKGGRWNWGVWMFSEDSPHAENKKIIFFLLLSCQLVHHVRLFIVYNVTMLQQWYINNPFQVWCFQWQKEERPEMAEKVIQSKMQRSQAHERA